MAETTLNAKVTHRMEVAPGLMIMRVTPVGWSLPPFVAGQFAVLGLPASAPRCAEADADAEAVDPQKLVRRAYSVSSSSQDRDYLEFYISLVRSGSLTPRLFALKIGDPVWLSPKLAGMFTLKDVSAEQNIVLVATGTGLAPYVSMLRTHLEAGGTRRFAVLHGARHSWDLGYHTELFTLQRFCPNFAYLPIISEPQEEVVPWKGTAGHVQALWQNGALEKAWGFEPHPSNTHVFLCGHPRMIEDMTVLLRCKGYAEHSPKAPGQIHCEKYW